MGVDGGWLPLPTRPQRNCDPASLVLLIQDITTFRATTIAAAALITQSLLCTLLPLPLPLTPSATIAATALRPPPPTADVATAVTTIDITIATAKDTNTALRPPIAAYATAAATHRHPLPPPPPLALPLPPPLLSKAETVDSVALSKWHLMQFPANQFNHNGTCTSASQRL